MDRRTGPPESSSTARRSGTSLRHGRRPPLHALDLPLLMLQLLAFCHLRSVPLLYLIRFFAGYPCLLLVCAAQPAGGTDEIPRKPKCKRRKRGFKLEKPPCACCSCTHLSAVNCTTPSPARLGSNAKSDDASMGSARGHVQSVQVLFVSCLCSLPRASPAARSLYLQSREAETLCLLRCSLDPEEHLSSSKHSDPIPCLFPSQQSVAPPDPQGPGKETVVLE